MKKVFSCLAFVTLVVAGGAAAQAQTSPSPAPSPMMSPAPAMSPGAATSPAPAMSGSPSPSPSPSPPPKFIQFSGFADLGYTSRAGDTTTQFTNLAPSRVFDYYDRTVDLQNLNIQAVLTSGNLTGKLEVSNGTDANIIQSWPGAFNGSDLTQAYLAYTFGKFTAQAGKFETLAGAEVIESPSDLNFSRSILFGFAVPFTHTGGRVTYALNPHINLIGGVNAGWDEIRSTNGRLTAEYGLAYNPSAAASLAAQGYTGFEQLSNYTVGFNPLAPASTPQNPTTVNSTPSGAQGQRSLLDVVGTVHPNGATTLTFNYDRGLQQNYSNPVTFTTGTAGWSGLAGYASYNINSRLTGSIRYEGFHDPQGFRTGIVDPVTGVGPFWREGTVTLQWQATPAVAVRGEYRADVIDQSVFLRNDGGTANTNATFGLETFVKF